MLTEKEWIQIKKFFKNKCAYCGISEKECLEKYDELLHQEHIIPLIEQGAYGVGNIVPACRSCNSSKGNKSFEEWYSNHKSYSSKREKRILEYINRPKTKE